MLCAWKPAFLKSGHIYEDNQSTICSAKNQQIHEKTKHIDIKYHFVHDLVEAGRIKVEYCASEKYDSPCTD